MPPIANGATGCSFGVEPARVDAALEVAHEPATERGREELVAHADAQHRPRPDLVAVDLPDHVAHAHGEHLGRVLHRRGEVIERAADLLDQLADDRFDRRVLGAEVQVEGAEPDVRGLGDVGDRGRLHALVGDDPPGRVDELGPGRSPSAAPAARAPSWPWIEGTDQKLISQSVLEATLSKLHAVAAGQAATINKQA